MARAMNIQSQLDRRRRQLGLSCAALAAQTGLGLRTVQRVLSGEETNPGITTLQAIATCLGVSLRIEQESADAVRRRQARHKSRQLAAIVQGSSALEAQALSAAAVRKLEDRMVKDLLAGSARRLWAK